MVTMAPGSYISAMLSHNPFRCIRASSSPRSGKTPMTLSFLFGDLKGKAGRTQRMGFWLITYSSTKGKNFVFPAQGIPWEFEFCPYRWIMLRIWSASLAEGVWYWSSSGSGWRAGVTGKLNSGFGVTGKLNSDFWEGTVDRLSSEWSGVAGRLISISGGVGKDTLG